MAKGKLGTVHHRFQGNILEQAIVGALDSFCCQRGPFIAKRQIWCWLRIHLNIWETNFIEIIFISGTHYGFLGHKNEQAVSHWYIYLMELTAADQASTRKRCKSEVVGNLPDVTYFRREILEKSYIIPVKGDDIDSRGPLGNWFKKREAAGRRDERHALKWQSWKWCSVGVLSKNSFLVWSDVQTLLSKSVTNFDKISLCSVM